MNAADFDVQFNRLTGHFHMPTDASRETLGMDWYQAVQGYDSAILERAVTTLTRTSQDRFWPPLGRVLDLCRGQAAGTERGGKCATCHGSSWLESAPFLSNGMIYSNAVVRCPDCRVPPPAYNTPHHRTGLTASEYREWSQRETQPQYMPTEQQAKVKPDGEWAPLKPAMDALRRRLFPRVEEVA